MRKIAVSFLAGLLAGCPGPETDPPSEEISAVESDDGVFDPAEDNSPGRTELTFIAGLGMMDGTNCDRWPKDFEIKSAFVVPEVEKWNEQLFATELMKKLEALGIEEASVFGSKYAFEIREIEDPRGGKMIAALDPVTQTGYGLSRTWLCTQGMAERGECTVHRVDLRFSRANLPELEPSDLDPATYSILVRARPPVDLTPEIESTRVLAVLTAPDISVQAKIVLDADVLLATDVFASRGAFFVEPRVTDSGAQTWEDAIGYLPRTPFFGMIAEKLLDLEVDIYAGGGADRIFVSDDYSASTPPPTRSQASPADVLVRASDLFEITHRNEALGFSQLSDHVSFGGIGCDDECSSRWYQAVETSWDETRVDIRLKHPVRSNTSGELPEVFVACAGGDGCEQSKIERSVRLWRARPTLLETLDIDRMVADLLVAHADPAYLYPRGACTGRRPNPDVQYCMHFSESTTCEWAIYDDNQRTCTTAAACEAAAMNHPQEIDHCTRRDQVNVCVTTSNMQSVCYREQSYRPLTGYITERIRAQVVDLMKVRFFTASSNYPAPKPTLIPQQNVSIKAPVLPIIEIVTRGQHAELLAQSAENQSLRSGEVSDAWASLAARIDGTLPDPRPELFGIEPRTVERARIEARANDLARDGVSVNAIGQPYGAVAMAWRLPPSATGQQTFFLDALEQRWSTVGDEVARLDGYIRYGNLQGTLRQHSEAGFQLATKVGDFADERRQQLEDQKASVAATAARIDELTVSVSQQQQAYVTGMAQIWRCDPTVPAADARSCLSVMTSHVDRLHQACLAQGPDRLGDLLGVIGEIGGLIGSIASAAQFIVDNFQLGADLVLDLAPRAGALLEDVRSFLADVNALIQKAKEGADSAQKFGKFLGDLLGAVEAASCDRSTPAYTEISNHLTNILDMKTTLESFSLELAELGVLLERFAGDVRYYEASAAAYERLGASVDPVAAYYDAARRGNREATAGDVIAACPLARAAVDASLIDIYRATQSLATTLGAATTKPYLEVPASGAYPTRLRPSSWREHPIEHGFLYSLWDTARFASHIYDPTGRSPERPVVNEVIARFDEFKLTEVCRSAVPELPNGLFLVTKKIDKAGLAEFLGHKPGNDPSRLRFEITLDDLALGASSFGPDVNLAQMKGDGVWSPVSPPVVLAVAYRVENGVSTTFSGTYSGYAGPGIAAPQSASIPYDCSSPERSSFIFPVDGQDTVAASCLAPVLVEYPGAETLAAVQGAGDPYRLLDDYRSSSNPSGVFCQVSHGTLVPNSLVGRPLLGLWTVTPDRMRAHEVAMESTEEPTHLGADVAWQQANRNIASIEIFFVVGTGVLPNGEAAHYQLTQP